MCIRDRVGDLVGDLHGLLDRLVDGDDAAYEVGALRLLSLHHPPRETELHGLRLADRARQALSTARPRHDAEIDLRLAEHGVVAGEDDVATHGELAAAAERVARNRGDNGFAPVSYTHL